MTNQYVIGDDDVINIVRNNRKVPYGMTTPVKAGQYPFTLVYFDSERVVFARKPEVNIVNFSNKSRAQAERDQDHHMYELPFPSLLYTGDYRKLDDNTWYIEDRISCLAMKHNGGGRPQDIELRGVRLPNFGGTYICLHNDPQAMSGTTLPELIDKTYQGIWNSNFNTNAGQVQAAGRQGHDYLQHWEDEGFDWRIHTTGTNGTLKDWLEGIGKKRKNDKAFEFLM